MREGLAKSKNLVSIRILQAIGVQYAQDYVARFGFDPKQHPPYLPMALGAGSVTPMQMAVGYAAFANGGFRVSPYFIKRIEDEKGKILEQSQPTLAAEQAKQIIDPRNAFLMTSMMQDVIQRGTATKAKQLGRTDLAGKTGTTNNHVDAWFCGYQADLVAISWIGFDNPKPLGNNETGGHAALPMWMSYMSKALKGVPVAVYTPPSGITAAKINSETGLRDAGGTMTEYFLQEQLPPEADNKADEALKSAEEVIKEFLSH
jgi:penicillin-binding protein 1A